MLPGCSLIIEYGTHYLIGISMILWVQMMMMMMMMIINNDLSLMLLLSVEDQEKFSRQMPLFSESHWTP